jgi:uncharacterized protein YutE (UPF0331/DUF86 family)
MTSAALADKASFVREALAALDTLPLATLDEFLADRRNLPSALHWLQTAIQALIDIGLVVVAARGLPPPRTSGEVLERLEAAGAVPHGTAQHYLPIIGFRNRVVHLYDRVDPAIVYRIAVEDRGDLVALLDLLLDAIPESSA